MPVTNTSSLRGSDAAGDYCSITNLMSLQNTAQVDLKVHLLEAADMIAREWERLKSQELPDDLRQTIEDRIIQLQRARTSILESLRRPQ
jgi:hypothetical protein